MTKLINILLAHDCVVHVKPISPDLLFVASHCVFIDNTGRYACTALDIIKATKTEVYKLLGY